MIFMFRAQRNVFQEPKLFYSTRVVTATIVSLLYSLYLLFLGYQIWTDMPMLQLAREHIPFVKAPDIEMCGYGTDIQIARCDFTWKNWTTEIFDNCAHPNGTTWIIAGPKINEQDFCYLFSGNDHLFFGDKYHEKNYLQRLSFYFKFKNATASERLTISVPVVAGQLLDPDFNPIWNKTKLATEGREAAYNDFKSQSNNFGGVLNQTTIVKMTAIKLQEIKPGDFKSILGLRPDYINSTIISQSSIYYPLHESDQFGPDSQFSGNFQVEVGSFTIVVLTEKRVKTMLGSLGVAGGAFGIICTIYFSLYGDRKMQPWGLMHRMIKSEVSRFGQMPNVPLISPIRGKASEELTTDERMARMEDRFQELEGFLSDYVIDTTALRLLSKNQNSIDSHHDEIHLIDHGLEDGKKRIL
ncbi:hypothetical protein G9A89_004268 [Geosiphon pyriformis]|nr:hypothetical protein G9A89_004268 [Geosiphon pyriformis]